MKITKWKEQCLLWKYIRNVQNNVLGLQYNDPSDSPTFKSCIKKVGGKLFENILYGVHNRLIILKATSIELLFQFQE